jgi:hypothetical protein
MLNAVNTTCDRAMTALECYRVHCDFYSLFVGLINDCCNLFFRVFTPVVWTRHDGVIELNPVRTLIYDAINRGPKIVGSLNAKISSFCDLSRS